VAGEELACAGDVAVETVALAVVCAVAARFCKAKLERTRHEMSTRTRLARFNLGLLIWFACLATAFAGNEKAYTIKWHLFESSIKWVAKLVLRKLGSRSWVMEAGIAEIGIAEIGTVEIGVTELEP
jgi:hypothetical protein